ncbi:MAG: OsmC family protein [Gammaproteobacteria bacterium]|nr:OsmC family protein [Gammaproteobacteria bacterium]
MKDTVTCDFKQEMFFEAEVDGHKIAMDAVPAFGGKDRGPRPKPLMLAALCGCTGMDVVAVLNKMRVPVAGFKIYVDGGLTKDHPMYYNDIHVVYEFSGKDLPKADVEKAVSLSQEKYCGVIAALKKAAKVTYEIKYV